MVARRKCATIHLCTEDSGGDAHQVLLEVAKKCLFLADQEIDIAAIDLREQPENVKRIVGANLWKESSNHFSIVALRRFLATEISKPNVFIFFHFDGDRRWSQRDDSENVAKFKSLILEKVHALVKNQKSSDDEVQYRMSRLIQMTPFYSMEAWLYQNFTVALEICKMHGYTADIREFESWRDDPSLLDERPEVKDCVRMGNRHNLELAGRSFPSKRVYQVGKSFARVIDSLRACTALIETLGKIRRTADTSESEAKNSEPLS